MKLLTFAITVISFGIAMTNSLAAENVTRASGGSMKTELTPGNGVFLNKKSSLEREWITVHDSAIPAAIIEVTGVEIFYRNQEYWYRAIYNISSKIALSAIEVRFLLFDIWGNHSENLSSTDIIDIEPETIFKFNSRWNIFSENEASEYYASIAYIAQVRTKNGKVIKANYKTVLEEARKFSKKFSEEDLEQKPEK